MDTFLYTLLVVVILIALAATLSAAHFYLARFRAVRDGKRTVPLFGGFVKLVLWELNEGLVFMRNKVITSVINKSDGGIKVIYPILGDELRARIPLTTRMVLWQDENILTRESIQVRIKLAIWWKVADLKKFVFEIDKTLRIANIQAETGLLESAEIWLKTVGESELRTKVSQLSVAFLVSSKASSYLHIEQKHGGNGETASETSVSDVLTGELNDTITRKVQEYGVAIQQIEIQEISFAVEIQQAIDKVWKASLLPAQTEQEAKARQIELQAVANVLGKDAAAINEIMKNFQGSNFYSMPQFVDQMFSKMNTSDGKQIGRSPEPRLIDSGVADED
jgi:regulator of protease activity HflC (stomatin/prohibitin superfamily)